MLVGYKTMSLGASLLILKEALEIFREDVQRCPLMPGTRNTESDWAHVINDNTSIPGEHCSQWEEVDARQFNDAVGVVRYALRWKLANAPWPEIPSSNTTLVNETKNLIRLYEKYGPEPAPKPAPIVSATPGVKSPPSLWWSVGLVAVAGLSVWGYKKYKAE